MKITEIFVSVACCLLTVISFIIWQLRIIRLRSPQYTLSFTPIQSTDLPNNGSDYIGMNLVFSAQAFHYEVTQIKVNAPVFVSIKLHDNRIESLVLHTDLKLNPAAINSSTKSPILLLVLRSKLPQLLKISVKYKLNVYPYLITTHKSINMRNQLKNNQTTKLSMAVNNTRFNLHNQ